MSTERRARLLAAAAAVFAEQGYHRARVSDIVARAGLSQGSFYLSFPSKREALLALVDQCIGEQRAILAQPIDIGDLARLEEQIRAIAAASMRNALRHRELYRIFYREAPSAVHEAIERVSEFEAEETRQIADTLREVLRSGQARPFDPDIVATCIFGMFDYLIKRFIVFGDEPVDIDRLATEAVRLELFGILAPPPLPRERAAERLSSGSTQHERGSAHASR